MQEMRRRTWALVRMSDIFFSHQLSLPSMIYDHDCDTQLPTNVFDEEFGPDTKVLPPSRPRTEPTPIAYMIAKATLSIEMGNILQATTKIGTSPPYDEILRLDARLREIHAELPPHLKMAPLDGSGDPVTLIIARFNLDILYQKVLCLLHRKYLVRARHNSRYAHSRRTAIEASLDTLRHLATLHRESQPGGRLRSLKWYFNTIATKDFLLPAMLLALDLHYDCSGERGLSSISSSISSPSSSTAAAGASSFSGSGGRQNSQALYFWTPEQRREMVECLSRTREIWHGLRDESMEAYKASSVLEVMLEKIKSSAASSSRGSASADHMGTGSFGAQGDFGIRGAAGDPMKQDILFGGQFGSGNELGGSSSMQQEHSAAMTLGMLSSDNSSSSGAAMTPNTAAFFDSAVQSPGGGIYSNMDLSGGGGGGGGSGGDAGGSAGPMATDFPPDVFSMANVGAPSPLSMFTNMGTGVDLGANFDWVSDHK